MNTDCWEKIITFMSVQDILTLTQCSKYFQNLCENSTKWVHIGKKLKLDPPKFKAKKYKTWKSIVLKKPFCELCCSNISKSENKILHRNLSDESNCYACFTCRYNYTKDGCKQLQRRLETMGQQLNTYKTNKRYNNKR